MQGLWLAHTWGLTAFRVTEAIVIYILAERAYIREERRGKAGYLDYPCTLLNYCTSRNTLSFVHVTG